MNIETNICIFVRTIIGRSWAPTMYIKIWPKKWE